MQTGAAAGPAGSEQGVDVPGVNVGAHANAGAASLPAPGSSSLDRPLLKMSELAERSGVSAGTIRYYLREGLLGERRGHRPDEPQHGLLPAARTWSGSS